VAFTSSTGSMTLTVIEPNDGDESAARTTGSGHKPRYVQTPGTKGRVTSAGVERLPHDATPDIKEECQGGLLAAQKLMLA
jgi:hypothetical protein